MKIDMLSPSVINTNFYGKMTKTEKGNDYYKTDNGFKVGAVYGGLELINGLLPGESLISAIIGFGIHSGIGKFIDYKRNQHAAQAADYIKEVGEKRALETRDDLELSDNKHLYYHSKDGAKYGTIIGAGIGAALGSLAAIFPGILVYFGGVRHFTKKSVVAAGAMLFAIFTGISTLGGFILGKITDYFTNKSAKKHA